MDNLKKLCYSLVLVLVFLLVGCGGDSNAQESTPSGSSPSPSDTSKGSPVSISEQVVFDQDGIVVTLTSLESSAIMGTELKVLIENNTDSAITVTSRDESINGVMVNTMFSVKVEPGKKANDSMSFFSSSLKSASITTIKDIEFKLHIYDPDTWDTIADSETLTITTSADAGFKQGYNDAGNTIYEEGGIKVVLQELVAGSGSLGPEISVYVENFSDADIRVQLRKTSVNGFMIEPYFTCEVISGKRAFDSIEFFKSDLDDSKITSIEELEFSLYIREADSWDTIAETDMIIVTFD